ncbi:hypothetical protein ACOMHN_017626 [Nucella lapillus]
MATETMDMITKRPRTPNDQYTCLTDQQKKNIYDKSSSNAHFFIQKPHHVPNHVPNHVANKRHTMDRYATNTSQYLFRGQPGSNPVCWVGDQFQRGPPEQHNTSRLGASLPWGPEKMGSRTYSHFDGEDVHRYLNIDVYRRHPTNMIGRVLQKHGRPSESYYHQRNPNTATWFQSSHVLNQTDVLQDIRPKTMAEYQLKAEDEKLKTMQRADKWPIYSEYTDCYALRSKTLPSITTLGENKKHLKDVW